MTFKTVRVCSECWWTLTSMLASRPICFMCKKRWRNNNFINIEWLLTESQQYILNEIIFITKELFWNIIKSYGPYWIFLNSKSPRWSMPGRLWWIKQWVWRGKLLSEIPWLLVAAKHNIPVDRYDSGKAFREFYWWKLNCRSEKNQYRRGEWWDITKYIDEKLRWQVKIVYQRHHQFKTMQLEVDEHEDLFLELIEIPKEEYEYVLNKRKRPMESKYIPTILALLKKQTID